MKKTKDNQTKPKKDKKIIVIFGLVIIVFILSVFARYILNKNEDFYTRTKEFYFNSDKLKEDCPEYQIENWSGVGNYFITIGVNSKDNSLLATSYDIGYNISYKCSDNVVCSLSKNSSTIYSATGADSFSVQITPNTPLDIGDIVYVEVTASANAPYEKTLKGRFSLKVGRESLSYEIIDKPNAPYLELSITNTIPEYKIVQVDFDPDIVLLDMTDSNYLASTNTTTIVKNTYNYVDGITFRIEAETSTRVRFYKVDQSQNYTNSNSIITLLTL